MLEPLLNLGLLVGLVCLSTRRTVARPLLAGLAIGLALVSKYWALIDVVLLGMMVWARRGVLGRFGAFRYAGGVIGIAAAVAGPFFIAAPAMWHQTVVTQLARFGEASPRLARAAELNPLRSISFTASPAAAATMAVLLLALVVVGLLPLVRALRGRELPGTWSDEIWWGIIAAVHLGVLGGIGVFWYHYAAWGAAPLALVVGAVAERLWRRLPGWRDLPGTLAVLALAVACVFVLQVRKLPPTTDLTPLRSWAQSRTCVWAGTQSTVWAATQVLVAANAASANLARGCSFTIDPVGVFLASLSSTASLGDDPAWRTRMFTQLEASDGVILPADRALWWLDEEQTATLERKYAKVGELEALSFWDRKG